MKPKAKKYCSALVLKTVYTRGSDAEVVRLMNKDRAGGPWRILKKEEMPDAWWYAFENLVAGPGVESESSP